MTIKKNNYETYLIDFLHQELPMELEAEMKQFLAQNPDVQAEFELLQETISEADTSIVFEKKDALIQKAPMITMSQVKKTMAIAASVISFLIAVYYFFPETKTNTNAPQNVSSNQTKPEPQKTTIPEAAIDDTASNLQPQTVATQNAVKHQSIHQTPPKSPLPKKSISIIAKQITPSMQQEIVSKNLETKH